MVQPDFYGVVNGEEVAVILPQASEEYGPISHYLLVVVPENERTKNKEPDQYLPSEVRFILHRIFSLLGCIFLQCGGKENRYTRLSTLR